MNTTLSAVSDVMDDRGLLRKLDSLSSNDVARRVTGFLDLPDELILQICRHLSPAGVLHCFYTPERPYSRPHTTIRAYYRNIRFDRMAASQYDYIHRLCFRSKDPLRPAFLTLSNKHVSCLIERFFREVELLNTPSFCSQLLSLTLIDCSTEAIYCLSQLKQELSTVAHIHFIGCGKDVQRDRVSLNEYRAQLVWFLFEKPVCSFQTVNIDIRPGLSLYQSIAPQPTILNANLVLETIDDLYILLNGLVPNAQSLNVQVVKNRLLTSHLPDPVSRCRKLRQFTLLTNEIELKLVDVKHAFIFIPNTSDLTLTIGNTSDYMFCHGPSFESILNEHFPSLERFDYNLTHRVVNMKFVGGFIQWPMDINLYEVNGLPWAHLCSHPRPSMRPPVGSRVRQTPYLDHLSINTLAQFDTLKVKTCRVSKITTSLPIPIPLPSRITTVVLTEHLPSRSSVDCIQRTVRHLTVERRLVDERALLDIAHCFPDVEYLYLLLPQNFDRLKSCFQRLVGHTNDHEKTRTFRRLRYFSTENCPLDEDGFFTADDLRSWLLQNTYLKHDRRLLYVHQSWATFSLWL